MLVSFLEQDLFFLYSNIPAPCLQGLYLSKLSETFVLSLMNPLSCIAE